MGIWYFPALAELCDPLHCIRLSTSQRVFQESKLSWRGVWDWSKVRPLLPPSRSQPGHSASGLAQTSGSSPLCSCLCSVLRYRFWIFWVLSHHHYVCLGGLSDSFLGSCFRVLTNLSLQMSVLQCWVKWYFVFYVCKQHMVCSQLLKLTKYLRICLNTRSYKKNAYLLLITFHLILMIDFWRMLWGFFFFLCYHYFAFMLMLIFFLCLSPVTLVISSYNFLPPVVEYISSLWAFCCLLKFCFWLAAKEFLHIICLSCKTESSERYENCCF